MIGVAAIREVMVPEVEAVGCFVVDVEVSRENDVTLTIESEEGIVDMDMCVKVNDAFLARFDRDVEDYSLTVTSAGLDQPFKVLKQYVKAVGSKVEARLKGGKKLVAVLESADENAITLYYTAREAVEGKKKKEDVEHHDVVPMTEVNTVMPYIEFE